jgi:hypothetical protein
LHVVDDMDADGDMATLFSRKMTLLLGLFSGSSLSACWIAVNNRDYIGAVAVGTAACAMILLLLRFEGRTPQHRRRRGDADGDAYSA